MLKDPKNKNGIFCFMKILKGSAKLEKAKFSKSGSREFVTMTNNLPYVGLRICLVVEKYDKRP